MTAEDKNLLEGILAQHSGESMRPPALVELDALQESDKRIAVVSTPVEQGWTAWLTGAGDDIATGVRGGGSPFYLEFEGACTKTVDVNFVEPVQVNAGDVSWSTTGWSHKDTFDVGVFVPGNKIGTSLSLAEGGSGDVNVVPFLEGINMIVPASQGGMYKIDLSKASPVYANKNGMWGMDILTGTLYPVPDQTGDWHLLDNDVQPYFARRIPMGYPDHKKLVESHKTKLVHPTHTLRLTVNKVSPGEGWVQSVLHAFRVNTL